MTEYEGDCKVRNCQDALSCKCLNGRENRTGAPNYCDFEHPDGSSRGGPKMRDRQHLQWLRDAGRQSSHDESQSGKEPEARVTHHARALFAGRGRLGPNGCRPM